MRHPSILLDRDNCSCFWRCERTTIPATASKTLCTSGTLKSALVRTYADVESNHTLQMAAALSYYFVMALFPALIFLSAIRLTQSKQSHLIF
jgi:hypothetical protein